MKKSILEILTKVYDTAVAGLSSTSAPSTGGEINFMDSSIRDILTKAHTIAVVGLSNHQDRYSYLVAKYLQNQGYKVVPVNPNVTEVLGEKAYPDLASIPFPIDMVDVFRNSAAAREIVDQAIAMEIPVVWLQLGINVPNAQQLAASSKTICIDNCCIKVEHHRLLS